MPSLVVLAYSNLLSTRSEQQAWVAYTTHMAINGPKDTIAVLRNRRTDDPPVPLPNLLASHASNTTGIDWN